MKTISLEEALLLLDKTYAIAIVENDALVYPMLDPDADHFLRVESEQGCRYLFADKANETVEMDGSVMTLKSTRFGAVKLRLLVRMDTDN